MGQVTCPTCKKKFESAESKAMPFCSDRCKRIDLGRWLSEEISVPYRELGDSESSERRDTDSN